VKIGIVYASKTGQTKRLADRAADRLRSVGLSVDIDPVETAAHWRESSYDLIFAGSYCRSTALTPAILAFLDTHRRIRRLAVFVTHAAPDSGLLHARWAGTCETQYRGYCVENGAEGAGYFHCRAKPSVGIAWFIRFSVFRRDRPGWKAYRKGMYGYPDTKGLERFDAFVDAAVRQTAAAAVPGPD